MLTLTEIAAWWTIDGLPETVKTKFWGWIEGAK